MGWHAQYFHIHILTDVNFFAFFVKSRLNTALE